MGKYVNRKERENMSGTKQGITIAGNILVDHVKMIEKYPEKNMLVNITDSVRAVGGCVPNTIINMAKIDRNIPLAAIGKVGDDENGRFVMGEMAGYGIDVSGVKVTEGTVTSYTDVMTEKTTGARTFFFSAGANREFGIEDVDVDALDCRIFHAGYILLLDALDEADDEYGTRMARLLHDVSAKGIKTSVDAVSEEGDRFREKIVPALRYCDYSIMNEIECCKVVGLSPRKEDGSVHIDNIKAAMEAFMEYGVREKVIVHCCEAGFLLDKSGGFAVVPSLKLPEGYIKGSVGAGDSFAAACLYGLYNEFDNTKLLEFASAAAACNLTASDSVSGMKTRAQIEKICEEFERVTL